MVNLVSKIAIIGVGLIAIAYQFFFKSIIFDTLGYGRQVLSIKDFNHVKCEKVDELGLEGCEDMWLHEGTGHLYMACSDSHSRTQWLPAVNSLNASARALTDRIAVLDTRGPGRLASRIKWLSVENFSGINGDGTLNLHGFDIRGDRNTDTLRIILVNHRPPIDPVTHELLDATVIGANSTVEQFQTKVGSDTMRHVRTYSHPLIQTPNRVAWVTDHSFVFTNDHSNKVGFRRRLDPFIGGGSVGYCDRNTCNIAYSGLKFPNGLVRGRGGLIYVPSTIDGTINVFTLTENHLLQKVNDVKVPLPIDNLSIDKKGDIYAATLPKIYQWAESSKAPFDIHPPSAVYRIRRPGKGYGGSERSHRLEVYQGDYAVEKVVEDDGSILPGATIAVHDAETGRLFLGGAMSPYVSICESAPDGWLSV